MTTGGGAESCPVQDKIHDSANNLELASSSDEEEPDQDEDDGEVEDDDSITLLELLSFMEKMPGAPPMRRGAPHHR